MKHLWWRELSRWQQQSMLSCSGVQLLMFSTSTFILMLSHSLC
jgi:hypothetical protein